MWICRKVWYYPTFKKSTSSLSSQQTFQRCFNVAVRLIWHSNVEQPQINVERMCMLKLTTLKLTSLNNVDSTLSVSKLILTTLENVKTTRCGYKHFQKFEKEKKIYIYIYMFIYTKIKKPKTRCVRVNIQYKNTFSIVTNISVVLHNLLQCVWIKHFTKFLHTQQKLKIN